MKIFQLKTLAIIASAMVCAQSAQAGTWSLGASALVSPDPYRGYQDSPLGYRPGDSDDDRMKKLDKRRGTLMAGLAYTHNADWGILRTTFTGDTLDYSNGMIGDFAYLYKFELDAFTLVPGVGVTWSSKNQNKYYYGVSDNESRRSGLDSYTPSDSWAPYVELSANYKINKDWNAFFMGRYIKLSDEVKDSPMVDKSYTGVLMTGVSYSF